MTEMRQAHEDLVTGDVGRFTCPRCHSHDVSRLFVASLRLDSCECGSCGARWDEEPISGECREPADRESVLMPRRRQA